MANVCCCCGCWKARPPSRCWMAARESAMAAPTATAVSSTKPPAVIAYPIAMLSAIGDLEMRRLRCSPASLRRSSRTSRTFTQWDHVLPRAATMCNSSTAPEPSDDVSFRLKSYVGATRDESVTWLVTRMGRRKVSASSFRTAAIRASTSCLWKAVALPKSRLTAAATLSTITRPTFWRMTISSNPSRTASSSCVSLGAKTQTLVVSSRSPSSVL
mmetsp:Transcript_27686/g.49952  ORF Transcript_27686/g.49952 Transcript_27686/m.49952 type:complete len:215 (+) Transcript_27686:704-1348(+)